MSFEHEVTFRRTVPADDVRQAWITEGVGGWEMTFGEDKKRDRLLISPSGILITYL